MGHGVRGTAILGEEARTVAIEGGAALLGREVVKLTSRGTILTPLRELARELPGSIRLGMETYAALQWSSIDVVGIQLADSHSGILVRVHLDEGETTVGLKASFQNIAKVLEQRDQIVLSRVRSQVADIASGLPLWRLLDHHVVALDALSREVVMAERGGGSHAHGSHGLLLRDGGLALLVGPVAANRARSKPFAVHRV